MYHNTGAAIKVLATILAVLMMIGCVAAGVLLIVEEEEIELGLAIMIGGCLVSWLCGLMMAAFGELVSNTHKILKLLKVMAQEKPVVVMPQPVPENVPAAHSEYSAPVQKNEAAPVLLEQPSNNDINTNLNVCPTCGAPRKGTSAFCAFCGTKF